MTNNSVKRRELRSHLLIGWRFGLRILRTTDAEVGTIRRQQKGGEAASNEKIDSCFASLLWLLPPLEACCTAWQLCSGRLYSRHPPAVQLLRRHNCLKDGAKDAPPPRRRTASDRVSN